MPIDKRTFDTMVQAVLDRIVANTGITDIGRSSVIRSIVEALVAEFDIQYYQMGRMYNDLDPDTAQGINLERLIKILGVIRNPATAATGTVRFSRTTVATSDIPIPSGKVLSTRKDNDGKVLEFVTTADATLLTGHTYVDVGIAARVAGSIYVAPGAICIMNAPIMGIESVTNQNAIDGGTDVETDVSLRSRVKIRLDGIGRGTSSAIESAIRAISGIIDAEVLDQNRGVGTSDVVVVGAVMPLSQDLIDKVNAAISATKSAGVNVGIIYPTIKTVNISITITASDVDIAGNAILDYLSTLMRADPLIVNQMQARILSAYNDTSVDMTTIAPAANQTAGSSEIIRPGTITINGVQWNG